MKQKESGAVNPENPKTTLPNCEAFLNKTSGGKKRCQNCGINGITKKQKYILPGNMPTYLCYYCVDKLGGPREAFEWLKANAHVKNGCVERGVGAGK